MRVLILGLAVMVAGCQPQQSASQEAEERYNYLWRNHASVGDLCQAASDVKEALVKERAEGASFGLWNMKVLSHCELGVRD